MVLIQSKKHVMRTDKTGKFVILLLFVLFYFINLHAYAEHLLPNMSWFIIKDISEEAENDLELVEFHINKVGDEYYKEDYPYDGYFQEYTLYNNGSIPYTVRLGVMYQYRSEVPKELFKINAIAVRHQMDSLLIKNNDGEIAPRYSYAFINVVFPPRERTKIRVNDFASIYKYNNITYRWNGFAFRGTPLFTATICNNYLDIDHSDLRIEDGWINDILFLRRDSMSYDSLVSMLAEESSLSNRFFHIRKTNENMWEIEFTAEFVDKYRDNLSFKIDWMSWGGDAHRSYKLFNSEEKISPYRYVFLTNKQLQVIRNAYYARHGYIFRNPALRRMYEDEFFDPQFGNINYKPNPNFHEGMLTEIDRANIETIRRLEALAEN